MSYTAPGWKTIRLGSVTIPEGFRAVTTKEWPGYNIVPIKRPKKKKRAVSPV